MLRVLGREEAVARRLHAEQRTKPSLLWRGWQYEGALGERGHRRGRRDLTITSFPETTSWSGRFKKLDALVGGCGTGGCGGGVAPQGGLAVGISVHRKESSTGHCILLAIGRLRASPDAEWPRLFSRHFDNAKRVFCVVLDPALDLYRIAKLTKWWRR